MSGTGHDDFQELSGLLFEAKERYRSVRAAISHTVDGTIAEESNRRFVDWRFDQPDGPGMTMRSVEEHRLYGPDVPQDFYHEYEDTRETYYLWHEEPDRWREEACSPDNRMLRCAVFGSAKGPQWVYVPSQNTALYMPAGEKEWSRHDPYTDLSFMLDPSEESFYYALLDDTTVHKTGRGTTVAGREAIEVLVRTISWGYPPYIFHGHRVPEGTTDHLLLVDTEIGTILRTAARLEGREFNVAEVTEISYDEQFPEDTFKLELPGVEFRRS